MSAETEKYKISTLFPTPLVSTNLEREFTEVELNYVAEQFKNSSSILLGNIVSNKSDILTTAPEFSELLAIVNTHLAWYMETLYAPKEYVELYVTQSWLNWCRPGETHHLHAHSNSIVSGVIYIDVEDDIDEIQFAKYAYNPIDFPTKKPNIFNCDRWINKVKKGDLVMFPSHLLHTVPPTQSQKTRITLAFNTFAKGTFGEEVQKSLLVL